MEESAAAQQSAVRALLDRALALPAFERTQFLDRECSNPVLRAEVETLLEAASVPPATSDAAKRWFIVREVLDQALALPKERLRDYLDSACGSDASLRAEVESLLDAAAGDALLDGPALADFNVPIPPAPPSLTPGQRFSHYEIQHKIGEGGMGAVYQALDVNLGRHVALKVIAPQYLGAHARARFAREAKAASALNHPNIVTIYEYSSADGVDFIAMEHVSGVSLDQVLAGGDAPLETLLGYARQIAAALTKAHASGIVHRDLKPGNIMITPEGTAKVLDFGLAKQLAEGVGDRGETVMTRAGAILGTPAYMAPEQALGEPVTYRADIFSFGVILYEMVSGSRPFRGDSQTATLRQVISKEPAPITNPAVPPEVTMLIGACLRKEPSERLASLAEAVSVLSGTRSGSPSTASSGLRSPAPGPTAQPSRRWSTGWTLALLLAATLASGLYLVNRPTPAPPAARPVDLPKSAQDWIGQGEAYLARYDKEGYREKAAEAFQNAANLDPRNASAYVGLANAYLLRFATNRDPQFARLALDSAQQAVKLNAQLASAHTTLGGALTAVGRLDEAHASVRQALSLDPKSSMALLQQGFTFDKAGDTARAEASFRRAVGFSPRDWRTQIELGRLQYKAGRYEEAIKTYQAASAAAPDNAAVLSSLGASYHGVGRDDDAAGAIQKSLSLDPNARGFSNLGTLLFFMGRYRESAEAFHQAVNRDAQSALRWGNLGDAYRWVPGKKAESLKAYTRAIQLAREALATNPRDADLLASLALFHAKSGRPAEAQQFLTSLSSSLSTGGVTKPAVWYKLAVFHEINGDRARALQALEQAVTHGQAASQVEHDPELIALRRDVGYAKIAGQLAARHQRP